jgi:hypothetical protein
METDMGAIKAESGQIRKAKTDKLGETNSDK